MKHSSIFRSRWMAILWAAGVIWFALQVAAPEQPATNGKGDTRATDATGSPVSDEDAKKLEGILEGM